MAITQEQLTAIMPAAKTEDLADFCEALDSAMEAYDISTPKRQAAFLAQCAEESDQLWHQRDHYHSARGEEYASGRTYEGRKDLGDIHTGDGVHYKGRGLLQVTGLSNYARVSTALGVDFVAHPERLSEPKFACLSAAHYWKSHGLNELADKDEFITITKRINGGTNGLSERQQFWERAKRALAV